MPAGIAIMEIVGVVVAEEVTVTESAPDVLTAYVELPLYVAVIEWEPAVPNEVVSVADPPLRASAPRDVDPL